MITEELFAWLGGQRKRSICILFYGSLVAKISSGIMAHLKNSMYIGDFSSIVIDIYKSPSYHRHIEYLHKLDKIPNMVAEGGTTWSPYSTMQWFSLRRALGLSPKPLKSVIPFSRIFKGQKMFFISPNLDERANIWPET